MKHTFTILILFCQFGLNSFGQNLHAINEFIGSFNLEVSEFYQGKPVEDGYLTVAYHFNPTQVAFIPQTDGASTIKMIYDLETLTSTTLLDENNQKTGIKMPIGTAEELKTALRQVEEDSVSAKNDYDSFIKGEESRIIEGYNCQQYIAENEEEISIIWLAQDLKYNYRNMFSFFTGNEKNNRPQKYKFRGVEGLQGIPMLVQTKHKKENRIYVLKITNLVEGKFDPAIFDTADYQILNALGGQ